MLEIRHVLPGELAEAAIFFAEQEGRNPPQVPAKVMVAKQDGEFLAALFYHEEAASGSAARSLAVDWLAFRGTLAGELERCMTALLVQKALREGIPFITCPAREEGFIAECFERRGDTLLLDVARRGWTVLQKANRCQGCQGEHT